MFGLKLKVSATHNSKLLKNWIRLKTGVIIGIYIISELYFLIC